MTRRQALTRVGQMTEHQRLALVQIENGGSDAVYDVFRNRKRPETARFFVGTDVKPLRSRT